MHWRAEFIPHTWITPISMEEEQTGTDIDKTASRTIISSNLVSERDMTKSLNMTKETHAFVVAIVVELPAGTMNNQDLRADKADLRPAFED